MTSYIHLSGKKIEVEEKEEAILLEIEKPKVVEVRDELDISVEEEKKEEEPPKEEPEEEGGPKFKPEGFSWTHCDGNPRNHVQVISKFTKYPITECQTTTKNLEKSLIDILYSQIKSNEGKIYLIKY